MLKEQEEDRGTKGIYYQTILCKMEILIINLGNYCDCFVSTSIIKALKAENENIHYEAVCAAGTWEVDAAWSHIKSLANSELTDKWFRLAAIEAVASIRPQEAAEILSDLTQSDDEDIVEVAFEAMAMSGLLPDEYYDDDDSDRDERTLH